MPPERNASPKRPAARTAPVDAVTALLNDPTLRPGDIAVFPEGPKVFKGGQAPFRRGAFEDVRRSASVSGATRRAVLALGTAPVARAAPPAVWIPSAEAAPSRPMVAGIRVVYPVR